MSSSECLGASKAIGFSKSTHVEDRKEINKGCYGQSRFGPNLEFGARYGNNCSAALPCICKKALTLNTDGYHFKFSLDVRFNDWSGENYPPILNSSTGAFFFHGLGPAYGDNTGKVHFYIQTPDNVGDHGRGGGQVTTTAKLTEGVWYRVTVEKTADQVCIGLDKDTPACATRTVTSDQFQMKSFGALSWGTGSNIDGKDFMQE